MSRINWGLLPQHGEYLERVSALEMVRRQKHASYQRLCLQPGQRVLDAGCGKGADVLELSRITGPSGRVVGIDTSAQFVDDLNARRQPGVEACVANISALPFSDGEFDAVRADRVLQHVADVERAVSELCRVTKPGGVVYLGDSDWGGLLIDAGPATHLGDAVREQIHAGVTSPRVGRQLPRLAKQARLRQLSFDVVAYPVQSLELANSLWSLTRNLAAAVDAGRLDPAEARQWQAEQEQLQAEDCYLGIGVYICVSGTTPP
jgi:SAM-dependent methyltransferase